MSGLTPKQARFVAEYLIDSNATQAAIRAGYAKGQAAEVQGSRLLSNAKVRAAIDAGLAKIAGKLELSAERVLSELMKLGFSNMDDYVSRTADGQLYTDFSAVTRDQMAAVQEVTVESFTKAGESDGDAKRVVERVKFKLSDKRASLVDLGKHLNLFKDQDPQKLEVNVTISPLEDARRTAFLLRSAQRKLEAQGQPDPLH